MVCRFELPKSMLNPCHDGICYITNIKNGRKFGDFIEKTLVCNESAHIVINNICDEYYYTSSSEEYKNNEESIVQRPPNKVSIYDPMFTRHHTQFVQNEKPHVSIVRSNSSLPTIGQTHAYCNDNSNDDVKAPDLKPITWAGKAKRRVITCVI